MSCQPTVPVLMDLTIALLLLATAGLIVMAARTVITMHNFAHRSWPIARATVAAREGDQRRPAPHELWSGSVMAELRVYCNPCVGPPSYTVFSLFCKNAAK